MSKKKGAKTGLKAASAQAATGSTIDDMPAEPTQGQPRLQNDLIAIRSQILQHVNQKNKETVEGAIAALKDTQQIELERLSRQLESNLKQKLHQDIHSQVIQKIKQENLLEWNDLIMQTIEKTATARVETCVAERVQSPSKNQEALSASAESSINSIVDSRVQQAIMAERKRSEDSVWGVVRKNIADYVNPMIHQAVRTEKQHRVNAADALQSSTILLKQQISILNERMNEVNSSVTATLGKVNELTKQGVEKLQASTYERIAGLDETMCHRMGDLETTIGLQVESVWGIWEKFTDLHNDVQGRKWSTENYLDDRVAQDEDLMSFDDATNLTVSLGPSEPRHQEATLYQNTLVGGEEPQSLAGSFSCSKLSADEDLFGHPEDDSSHLEPGEIAEYPAPTHRRDNPSADLTELLPSETTIQDDFVDTTTSSTSDTVVTAENRPSLGVDLC